MRTTLSANAQSAINGENLVKLATLRRRMVGTPLHVYLVEIPTYLITTDDPRYGDYEGTASVAESLMCGALNALEALDSDVISQQFRDQAVELSRAALETLSTAMEMKKA